MTALTQRATTTTRYGLIFIVLSAGCWGSGTVMSKYALGFVPPLTLLAVQLATSSVFLWTLTRIRRIPFKRDWKHIRYGWTGMLEPGLAYMLGLAGLLRTTASSASFIGATEPILVIFLAWLLLKEHLSIRAFGLVILALIGTLLISASSGEGSTSRSLLGDGLVLAGTACAALYVVISRSSVEHVHPLPLAALQQSFGFLAALIVLPLALASGEAGSIANVPFSAWVWVIVTGIVQYALAFLFYLNAVQEIPATQAAIFLMLIPLFGVTGSALFLGEQLTLLQLAGGVLILTALAGVYLTRSHKTSVLRKE